MSDAKIAIMALALLMGGMSLAGHYAEEEDAGIQHERPHSVMDWKSRKMTQDEAEMILAATRERIEQAEKETKKEMERRVH